MHGLRLLSAALITTTLAFAACDGSGGHDNPYEAAQGAAGPDSLSAGTDIPSSAPPVGTVNPAAPGGPGTYGDSASPAAVGQPTSPATPGGPAQPPTPGEQAGDDSPRTP